MRRSVEPKNANIEGKTQRESVLDIVSRSVMLAFNLLATFLSALTLIVMAALRLKDTWVTISLGILLVLNLALTLVMFFTYSATKKSAAIKISKIAIKALRLLVSFINMGLTIVMWFTTYSNSVFMTVMLVIFTGFYGFVIAFQVFIMIANVIITIIKKAIAKTIQKKRQKPTLDDNSRP